MSRARWARAVAWGQSLVSRAVKARAGSERMTSGVGEARGADRGGGGVGGAGGRDVAELEEAAAERVVNGDEGRGAGADASFDDTLRSAEGIASGLGLAGVLEHGGFVAEDGGDLEIV